MQGRFGDAGDDGGVINNYTTIWHRGKDGDKYFSRPLLHQAGQLQHEAWYKLLLI